MIRTRRLSRRELLALLGVGVAGATVVGRGRLLQASSAPPGPTIPVPTVAPALLAPMQGATVGDLAASLEWDIDQMFQYVAGEIDYHPYSGVLRGANGTLWGRAGNSADQALLLGALLDEAAVPWRLAVGALDADAADKVANRTAPSVDDVRRRAADVLLPPDVAASWTGDGPWLRTDEIESLFSTARDRVSDTVDMLASALASAGAAPAEVPFTLPADELDQHVWVQYADGPNWIDLDPSVPDAAIGTAYAGTPETMASLPDDRFHTVTLRVVAEVVSSGVPTHVELVSHTVRSAEVAGSSIYVVHAPMSWLDITSGLTGDQQYVATIVVGDLAVEGGTPVVLAAGEGVADVLDDGTGAVEGQTMAEWFEVDVTVPQSGVRTASRLLYDRIPEGRRESGDLRLDDLPPIATTHVDDDIGDVFLPFAAPQVISIAGHPLPWTALAGAGGVAATPDDVIAKCAFAGGRVRDLVALDQLTGTGVAGYADEPVVASIQIAPNESPAGAEQAIVLAVDLLHNHRRATPLSGAATGAAAGLVVGAIDHAAERFLVDGVGPLLSSGYLADASAGRVFEVARESGIDIVTLTPGSAVDIAGIGPGPRALIEAALAAGRFVVIPESTVELAGAPRIGWWEYDPPTGVVVDRMDDGRGASAGEYALLIRILTSAACFLAGALGVLVLANAAQGVPGSLAGDMANATIIVGAGAACVA